MPDMVICVRAETCEELDIECNHVKPHNEMYGCKKHRCVYNNRAFCKEVPNKGFDPEEIISKAFGGANV